MKITPTLARMYHDQQFHDLVMALVAADHNLRRARRDLAERNNRERGNARVANDSPMSVLKKTPRPNKVSDWTPQAAMKEPY